MSNNHIQSHSLRYLILPAVLFALFSAQTTAHATTHSEETIDVYAKKHLLGQQGTGPQSGSGVELVLIQGTEKNRSAYLLFDGQYGRSVRRGETVREWTVVKITDDAVELRSSDRTETLMLGTDLGPDPAEAKR
jgi:hypothetical protein